VVSNNIDKAIADLAIDLSVLTPLPSNPRKGNVEAIMASYREFGQVRPIVITPNGDDGTFTVIAGNHQVEAARRLGWTQVAAVRMDGDMDKAIAFALADNRTVELGQSDNAAVFELMEMMAENNYQDLFDGLGWDEFEIAAYEEASFNANDPTVGSSSYVPPVIVDTKPTYNPIVEENADGERQIVAGGDVDHKQVAIQGSTVASPGSAPQAVVQYTLVFDDPEQQRRWYDFIRWLRNDPGYDGSTTAEKIMSFIDAHSEV